MKFNIASEEERGRTITLYGEFGVKVLEENHPHFNEIAEMLVNGTADDQTIADMIDPGRGIAAEVNTFSDRIVYEDGNIYFDGDLIVKQITRHIVRMIQNGDTNWKNLIRFMENIAANPSEKSRRHLYHWLDERDFQITEDGCFIAYKGVNTDGKSIHAGPGIVDGVHMNGHLPNEIGSTVAIARSYVDDDRGVGCSRGLHVGSYEYARSFGARLLTVKVNPRDVVSVPSDCQNQKVRVCLYKVLDIAPAHRFEGTSYEGDDDWGSDEDESCWRCGEQYDDCCCDHCDVCEEPVSDVCSYCDACDSCCECKFCGKCGEHMYDGDDCTYCDACDQCCTCDEDDECETPRLDNLMSKPSVLDAPEGKAWCEVCKDWE